jgi:hypothetical protein
MGGVKTARAIKNNTIPANRTARMNLESQPA